MDQLFIFDSEGRKRKAVKIHCTLCEKEFLTPERFTKTGTNKYCSKKCQYGALKKQIVLTCHWCSSVFRRQQSKTKGSKSGLHFCSRACKESAQSIEGGCKEIQPSHYGNEIPENRKRALKNLPQLCNRCGYKKCVEILQVHHIDKNRQNNKLSDLEVLCPTCHFQEHFENRDGIFWRKDKGVVYG